MLRVQQISSGVIRRQYYMVYEAGEFSRPIRILEEREAWQLLDDLVYWLNKKETKEDE